MEKVLNYFQAIRYLKFKQIFFRIYFRFFKLPVVTTHLSSPSIKKSPSKFASYTTNEVFFSSGRVNCIFLNEKRWFILDDLPWDSKDIPKLWVYQLQYFDYIHKLVPIEALTLMREWIRKNKAGMGLEPYPTSLRIINWIIYLSNHGITDQEIESSIRYQFSNLISKLEYHLLGNNLS